MKTAIIVSKKDTAGLNIKGCLLTYSNKQAGIFENESTFQFNPDTFLYTTENESIHCEDIDEKISADFFIFATKHQSSSGIHSLSVHAPGNWAKAEAGGKDKELCIAPAAMLKFALLCLMDLGKNAPFDLVQECTHHGPFLKKPCMFIEIGSDETHWKNIQAGNIIAKTIMHILNNPVPEYKIAFGIGGMHTTPNFKKVIERTQYALGHVCPKYMLEHLDKKMIIQAVERSQEKAELIILDWKGLKEEKQRIISLLDEMKLPWKKSHELY